MYLIIFKKIRSFFIAKLIPKYSEIDFLIVAITAIMFFVFTDIVQNFIESLIKNPTEGGFGVIILVFLMTFVVVRGSVAALSRKAIMSAEYAKPYVSILSAFLAIFSMGITFIIFLNKNLGQNIFSAILLLINVVRSIITYTLFELAGEKEFPAYTPQNASRLGILLVLILVPSLYFGFKDSITNQSLLFLSIIGIASLVSSYLGEIKIAKNL